MRKTFCIALLALLPLLTGGAVWAADECMSCHEPGSTRSVHHVRPERFAASVHAQQGLGCQDCHTTALPGENHAQLAGRQRVDCTQCHDQKNRHGHGAQCVDCHGSHYIAPVQSPASGVSGRNLARTCGTCHPEQAGRPAYLSWLPSLRVNSHGKQNFAGDYSGEDCLACHRSRVAHRTAEPDSPGSSQCRACHGPDAQGRSVLAGYFHPRADARQQPGTYAAAIIDMVFLGVMFVGGMIYFARLAIGRRHGRYAGNNQRKQREPEL